VKTFTGALHTAIESYNLHKPADLYTITWPTGVQRYTSNDVDVTWSATTWTSSKIITTRAKSRSSNDGSVDTMDLTLCPVGVTLGSRSMLAAAIAGSFSGVPVLVERAWFDPATSFTTVAGTEVVFSGTMVEVKPGTLQIDVVVKSYFALLNQQIPKRQITSVCPFAFGDSSSCGVTPATAARTAAAGSTTTTINLSSAAAGVTMVGGRIAFTSGTLTGTTRVIRTVNSTTQVVLDIAVPVAPTTGDGFTLRQGCDKSRSVTTGCGLYSNLARHGAYPDAPSKDAVEGGA
jgi:hypothetical protein